MSRNPDELVRRLAAGLRAAELYAPQHPLVQRSVASLASSCSAHLSDASSVVVGFIGDDVVVNDTRLGKGSASLTGFVRGLRDREIEKITFHRGVTADEMASFVEDHDYSILNTFVGKDGTRYVKVRNPWADTSPKIPGLAPRKDPTDKGIFDIPVGELRKYFADVMVNQI